MRVRTPGCPCDYMEMKDCHILLPSIFVPLTYATLSQKTIENNRKQWNLFAPYNFRPSGGENLRQAKSEGNKVRAFINALLCRGIKASQPIPHLKKQVGCL